MVYETKEYGKNGREIYLEYDKDKFSIQHVKEDGYLVLSRNNDGCILKVFDDNISFIVQNQTGNNYDFFVNRYDEKEGWIKFSHYRINESMNQMNLLFEVDSDSLDIASVRIKDNLFALKNRKNNLIDLYSPYRGEWLCSDVFANKNISEILGENVILVSEKRRSLSDFDLVDTLTYGLDVERFEVVTPIRSMIQDRFISLYSDREISVRLFNGMKFSFFDNFLMTMVNEVQKYLDLLGEFTKSDDEVMLDKDKVNVDFVKAFVKNKDLNI